MPWWWYIGLVDKYFANNQGDQGKIPDHIIPKTKKKWCLIRHCLTLSIIKYVSRVKWSNLGKGVAPSSTPWYGSYWKWSFWIALNYSHKLYLLLYIYIMCPWCNGYRRRKWTWWYEFKSWTRLITFHIALIPLGKVWIQLFSFQLWVNSRAD